MTLSDLERRDVRAKFFQQISRTVRTTEFGTVTRAGQDAFLAGQESPRAPMPLPFPPKWRPPTYPRTI